METLIVDAPSSSSARAVGGFAHGSSTEVLRTSVSRQLAVPLQPPERREDAGVGDEHRANAEPDGAPRLGDDQSTPAWPRATPPTARRGERLAARVPGAARPEEERDLDAVLGPERRHLRDLASVSIITPEPCETRRTGTSRASASSSTARSTSGPSTEGISIRYLRPSAKRASLIDPPSHPG